MIPDLDPELDLVLTRELNAPRALLWDCWTKPEHLVNWFVPKPHRVTACTLDVRPGGACNTTFDVDGMVMENTGVYLEVVPQEKLVFTDTYSVGWKPAPEPFMTAIITFQDLGDGRLQLGGGHRDGRLLDHLRVADAGQHVRDGVTHAHGSISVRGLRLTSSP